MEKENMFEKISVVPNENDFVDAIVSLGINKGPARVCSSAYMIKRIRMFRRAYAVKVRDAEDRLFDKFSKVAMEFPCLSLVDPLRTELLRQHFDIGHYQRSLAQISTARLMLQSISLEYEKLLKKDDCDSIDKCNRLKLAALARLFTVAKRCVRALAYLDMVREYMLSLPKNLEDDDGNIAATCKNKYGALPPLDYALPHSAFLWNIADLVDPDTLLWLEELEREHGLRVKDDENKEHELAVAISRMFFCSRSFQGTCEEMGKEKKFKKISSSVVPNENDFVEAILSLPELRKPELVCDNTDIRDISWSYESTIMSAEYSFSDMFSKVLDEFPVLNQVDPLYGRCLDELFSAREMVVSISSKYVQLLDKDDGCVSLGQLKSLLLAALASMCAVAKRCNPWLAHLERVRQYMANLDDDESTWKFQCHALSPEHDNLPSFQKVLVDDIACSIDPNTLLWLEELERGRCLELKDDKQEVFCGTLVGKKQLESIGDIRTSFAARL
ncbi:unnamed protein product [Arabis nemorensis]|uniref:NOG1 N-terminal helical domain-containing protein n=1 Tax=Arabis nemorensis TaxID=586526 RepID=A0A565B660_9BRAS|nr:unnamed protein product [Arabis nemorensis]